VQCKQIKSANWRQPWHLIWSGFGNPGFGSPPKYNQFVLGPGPTAAKNSSKSVWVRILIQIQELWSWSPAKSNRLVFEPRPYLQKISSKSVHNLLRYAAKCQFTPYLLMVKNPGKWSRIHERIRIAIKNGQWIGLVMYYPLAKVGDDMFSGFCVRMLTYMHSHTHTHLRDLPSNPLSR